MPKKLSACKEDDCWRPRLAPAFRCGWHWLAVQPIGIQELHAARRLVAASAPTSEGGLGGERLTARQRPPIGDQARWCAACQAYVPLFYYASSACSACQSRQAHRSHVQRTYGLSPDEYDALLVWQRGKCFVCARVPRSRRLAVDHDHVTGAVRGLLCADDERGCNHSVVGSLEAAAGPGNGLLAARRLADYLERSPLERLRAGEPRPNLSRPGPPKPEREPHDNVADQPPF